MKWDVGIHKAFLLHTQVRRLFQGKVLVQLIELQAERVVVFMQHHLSLRKKKCLTDKLWILRLGYLANSVSRMNEENLSLQKKQLAVCVAGHKIQTLNQN